jgi:hypothetical protein
MDRLPGRASSFIPTYARNTRSSSSCYHPNPHYLPIMRFHITLLTLLGTINMITALAVFTTPEVDTTSAHQNRPQVPAPQPPARFKQATRAGIVARQAQGPAKRQNSATPICNRPATGNTPNAIFTDAFFFTDKQIGQAYPASLQQCYAECEANPSKCGFPAPDRSSSSQHAWR